MLFEDRAGFPIVEPETGGIRINAEIRDYDSRTLHFAILVTYCFERAFLRCFREPRAALTVIVENAITGQSFARSLRPAHRLGLPPPGPNYDTSGVAEQDGMMVTSFLELPLELAVPPFDGQPSLFVRVMLHGTVSNVIAIDPVEAKVQNFMDGTPAELDLQADDDAEEDENVWDDS